MANTSTGDENTGATTGTQSAQGASFSMQERELAREILMPGLSGLTGATAELAQPALQVDPVTQAQHTQLSAVMRQMESELNASWLERQKPIHGALLALIAQQHMVTIGLPGEAKSAMVDDVRSRVEGAHGFKLLMTRFTTPEEVWGPVSLAGLKEDRYVRPSTRHLQSAHIAFLDEPFKASSSILNALLTALNERIFTDDGRVIDIPLRSLFGASNEMPQGEELGALWDRFTLRYVIEPLRGASLRRFLSAKREGAEASVTRARLATRREAFDLTNLNEAAPALIDQQPTRISLGELGFMQSLVDVAHANINERLFELYDVMLRELQSKGYKLPSTRRTGWAFKLVAANAVLAGRLTPVESDLAILGDVLWDNPKEAREIGVLALRVAAPRMAEATEAYNTIIEIKLDCEKAWHDKGVPRAQQNAKVVEARTKIITEATRIDRLAKEAAKAGEDIEQITVLLEDAKNIFREVTMLIV